MLAEDVPAEITPPSRCSRRRESAVLEAIALLLAVQSQLDVVAARQTVIEQHLGITS